MISVVIPTYNREKTILESVRSVLEQTWEDLELIVVDDASTDHTESMIQKVNDPRVKYIRQPYNQGACAARNRGIEAAQGEYIAFQDSDDLWHKDKLEKQMNFMKLQSADMVYCGMNRSVNGRKMYFPSDQKNGEKLTVEKLLKKNKISTQTILVKQSTAKSIMFDPGLKRLQDWDFSLRVLTAGFRVEYLGEALVDARVQGDSITSIVSSEKAYLNFAKKHHDLYQKYPKALGGLYVTLAYCVKNSNRKASQEYLFKSLNKKFDMKTLVKILFNVLRIW